MPAFTRCVILNGGYWKFGWWAYRRLMIEMLYDTSEDYANMFYTCGGVFKGNYPGQNMRTISELKAEAKDFKSRGILDRAGYYSEKWRTP